MNFNTGTLKSNLYNLVSRHLGTQPFKYLNANLFEARDIEALSISLGWQHVSSNMRNDVDFYESLVDFNSRRKQDALVIATAMLNMKPKIAVEIGTSLGEMTLMMHKNSPGSHIYTVNAPPELLDSGKGGKNTTISWDLGRIGEAFKSIDPNLITQVISDSKAWNPPNDIDFAFIDGCHDTEYVISDTKLILSHASETCVIVWHDANPKKSRVFPWVWDVCKGIDILIAEGAISGPLYLLQDSATLLYIHKK